MRIKEQHASFQPAQDLIFLPQQAGHKGLVTTGPADQDPGFSRKAVQSLSVPQPCPLGTEMHLTCQKGKALGPGAECEQRKLVLWGQLSVPEAWEATLLNAQGTRVLCSGA